MQRESDRMGAVIPVAGISHYQSAALLCSVGDAVVLRCNPANPHDRNAIQVWVGERMVGHVPRDVAARIAQRSVPTDFSARVVERLGGSNGYLVGLRIELCFDIAPMEPQTGAARPPEAEYRTRSTQFRTLVDELLVDRGCFPSDPALAYEVMECLRLLQSALAQGQEAGIANAVDAVRLRFATRRGVHAWRMSLLAAWWRLDAAESQRLAALLVAYVAEAPPCIAINRLVADVRLSAAEELRARVDADATALRLLDRAAVDDAGAFNLAMGLLRSDSAVRCVAEAAGVAAALSGDSARFIRLLSGITGACTESDRVVLDRSGLSRSFAPRITAALDVLPPCASLTPDERDQLDRIALPSSWSVESWGNDDLRGWLLLRLAGELGDAEADFMAAMRVGPAVDGKLDPMVESLLRRALQRGDPSTCALTTLASIATRAGEGGEGPGFPESRMFFLVLCIRSFKPQFSLFPKLAAPRVEALDECARRLDQLASRPGAPIWALICRDVALHLHEPRRIDYMAFADRIETAAVDYPELGWLFDTTLFANGSKSGDLQLKECFPDPSRAVRVFRMSVRRGHIQSASWLLSLLQSQPDCAEAGEVATLRELVGSRGSTADAVALAWQFAKGDGVPKDEAKATQWFGKAAAAGDAHSQCNYGFRLERGIGIAVDRVGAVDWYRKSAEAGSAVASYNMGCSYANGSGVAKDEVEAFKWFLNAANAGNADAMDAVAKRLQGGQGTESDPEQALAWAARLRATGDARGSLLLGKAHISGQGVPIDAEQARGFLEEGVQRGSADAAAALASLLSEADGARYDATQAFKWWLAAAELNHAVAMLRVADCYREGKGVEKNEALWLDWAERALSAGATRAAIPLARWFISQNSAEGDAKAAAALLEGLRGRDAESGDWLIELIPWAELRTDSALETLLEAARILSEMDPSKVKLLVASVLSPIVSLGDDKYGLTSIPWRRVKSTGRGIDAVSAQRRAANLVIVLGGHRDSEALGISQALRELRETTAASEKTMIRRGDIEDAWAMRRSVEPMSVRHVWEVSRASDFAIAAYSALCRGGPAELPNAQAWLAIAVSDDPLGISRYNLAIARTVADGMFSATSARLIEEAAAAGLKEARELEVQNRDSGGHLKGVALGVGLALLGLLIAFVTDSGAPTEGVRVGKPQIPLGVGCCTLLSILGGLIAFASVVHRLRVGSTAATRIDAATVTTHLGSFRIPCPHGHPSAGSERVDWLSIAEPWNESLQTRFRDRPRLMVKPPR